MADNLDEPVTKRDLKREIDGLRTELKADIADVRTELKSDIDRLETGLAVMKAEIIKEFNVVAENIRKDVATANRDEISQLNDRVKKNAGRLDHVEERLGISN